MKLLVAIIVLVVIGGGVGLYLNAKDTNDTEVVETANPAPRTSAGASSQPTTAAASTGQPVEVRYTASGFSPNSVTLKSGDKLKIIAEAPVEFASDPHPVHTDNKELNASQVGAGQNVMITLTKKGTFGFHNHLKSAQKGTITVE